MRREFEHFSLKSIGDLEGGKSGDEILLGKNAQFLGDQKKFSFATQGIFGTAHRQVVDQYSDRTDRHWGYTRDGEWILVDVNFCDRRVAREVGVREVSLMELLENLQNDPSVVWNGLRSVARDWKARAQGRYLRAVRLNHTQEMEEKVLYHHQSQ